MGAKAGLTPNEILDLEYWEFCACMEGYEERLLDLVPLTVLVGYYSGYYSKAKHPKKPAAIIAKIAKEAQKAKSPRKIAEITDEDISHYEELEKRRLGKSK